MVSLERIAQWRFSAHARKKCQFFWKKLISKSPKRVERVAGCNLLKSEVQSSLRWAKKKEKKKFQTLSDVYLLTKYLQVLTELDFGNATRPLYFLVV